LQDSLLVTRHSPLHKEAWSKIQEARYILVITHINPDADTISSALAFSNLFAKKKIKHKVFNASKEIPRNLDFLDRFDKITNQIPKFYDLIISVDCSNLSRFYFEVSKDIPIINIDHHKSNDNFGIINIVNYNKASSAEVVFDFFEANKLKISKEIAQCLYVGVYDDSLAFSTDRCDESTFEMLNTIVKQGANPGYIANMLIRRDSLAKYRVLPKVLNSLELHFEGKVATIYVLNDWLKQSGATLQECEEALDMILSIAVVDIAIFLRVVNNKVRVSLRSKSGTDVSDIAKKFDGGGHTAAAGCTISECDIFKAREKILEVIW